MMIHLLLDFRGNTCRGLIEARFAPQQLLRLRDDFRGNTCRGLIEAALER